MIDQKPYSYNWWARKKKDGLDMNTNGEENIVVDYNYIPLVGRGLFLLVVSNCNVENYSVLPVYLGFSLLFFCFFGSGELVVYCLYT